MLDIQWVINIECDQRADSPKDLLEPRYVYKNCIVWTGDLLQLQLALVVREEESFRGLE